MQRRSWLACSFMGSLHLSLASFSCCARTPTSHPQLRFCTALLLPALAKVHSAAEGGPLNLPQSMVIMLDMLNFFILFVQQYIIIICSHPRPLQHTSPQYVGLDVHLASMSQLQTRSSTLTKKARNCAAPFVFSEQAPCQASFRPLPLGLKSISGIAWKEQMPVNLRFRSKRQRKTLNQRLYLRPGITSRRIIYRVLSPYTERGFGVLHWHWGLRCVMWKIEFHACWTNMLACSTS